jgi:hydrogenase maturation protease
MTYSPLDEIVNAVLYEGYILYPYRPTSKKNQRERFTFGRVYPEAYSLSQNGAEPYLIQTECLAALAGSEATIQVSVRFLQPTARDVGIVEQSLEPGNQADARIRVVPELRTDNGFYQSWLEAVERRIEVPLLKLDPVQTSRQSIDFHFPSACEMEPIVQDEREVGVIKRRRAKLKGSIELTVQPQGPSLFRVTARILNRTELPQKHGNETEDLLLRTFASTHTVLNIQGGEFVSLMDPAPEHKSAANACNNVGTWPVLVGDEAGHARDTILSSPIILYDYPKIAPESAGSLFDGTEIDEILSLRILTMTDSEKLETRQVDEHARRLLERTERLDENSFWKMHGVMRPPLTKAAVEFDDFFGPSTPLNGVSVAGIYLRAGDRVRIRPGGRADVIDMALGGQTAIVEAIEQDAEKRIHLAVVLEADPGKDLGLMRQPGHRFFYGVDEVEPLAKEKP